MESTRQPASPRRATLRAVRRFVPTNKPLLRLLLKRSRAARSRGELRSAVRTAELASRTHPGDSAARLHLARVLMDEPLSARRLDRSAAILAGELEERPNNGTVISLYVANLVAQADADAPEEKLRELLQRLIDSPDETVARHVQQLLLRQVALGDTDKPLAFALLLFDVIPTRATGMLVHSVALRANNPALASSMSADLDERELTTLEDDAFLANELRFAEGDANGVIDTLLHLREFRERRYSNQLIRAYREIGAAGTDPRLPRHDRPRGRGSR